MRTAHCDLAFRSALKNFDELRVPRLLRFRVALGTGIVLPLKLCQSANSTPTIVHDPLPVRVRFLEDPNAAGDGQAVLPSSEVAFEDEDALLILIAPPAQLLQRELLNACRQHCDTLSVRETKNKKKRTHALASMTNESSSSSRRAAGAVADPLENPTREDAQQTEAKHSL